eukprot:361382_1
MASFHSNFDPKIWIGLLIFGGICCFTILLTLIFTIYKFRKLKQQQHRLKIRPIIKIYSICALVFFLTSKICSSLYVLYVKLPSGTVNEHTQSFAGARGALHTLAYLFTYLLWFTRIQSVFHNSAYGISKIQLSIFYILLSLYVLSQATITVIWRLFILEGRKKGWNNFSTFWDGTLWTRLVIDLILNIYVLYLFCSKMYKLTIKTTEIPLLTRSSIESTLQSQSQSRISKVFVNDRSPKMFEIMVKYLFLTFITVLSTQLFTISEIVMSASIKHAINNGEYERYYYSYMVRYTLDNIDAMISVSYIILSFPFTKKYYHLWCNCPHNNCVKFWSKSVQAPGYDEMNSYHPL